MPAGRRLMANEERVVARFNNGIVLKGYAKNFSIDCDSFVLDETGSGKAHHIALAELKALFFIKTFEGNSKHRDKKIFSAGGKKGSKVYIKFLDEESLVGFVDGEIPWEKGYFLSKEGSKAKGFYLVPVDDCCNNVKVFVVASSVQDMTVMVK